MGKYYRTHIQLRRDQYNQLRQLAHTLSQQRGTRVSVSQVIRELLDYALVEKTKWQQAQEALNDLIELGETIASRHPEQVNVETWLSNLREERTNELYNTVFDRC